MADYQKKPEKKKSNAASKPVTSKTRADHTNNPVKKTSVSSEQERVSDKKNSDTWLSATWILIFGWLLILIIGLFVRTSHHLIAGIIFDISIKLIFIPAVALVKALWPVIPHVSGRFNKEKPSKKNAKPRITAASKRVGIALVVCMVMSLACNALINGKASTEGNQSNVYIADTINIVQNYEDILPTVQEPNFFDFENPEPFETVEETMDAMINTLNDVAWEYRVPGDAITVNITNSEALCALLPEYSDKHVVAYRTLKDAIFKEEGGAYVRFREDYYAGSLSREKWKSGVDRIIKASLELKGLLYAQNEYDHDLHRQIGLRFVDISDQYVLSHDYMNAMYALEEGIKQVFISILYMRKSGTERANIIERFGLLKSYYLQRFCNRDNVLGEYIHEKHPILFAKYEIIENAVTLLLEHENELHIESPTPQKR